MGSTFSTFASRLPDMVSEFDLPCTACGHTLSRSTLADAVDEAVQVAVCPSCGTRHYPESALERLGTRRGR